MGRPADTIAAHLARLQLGSVRTIALPGNGGTVHALLRERLLAAEDPRCGVLTHDFQYGGSVPEGSATHTQLILADAVLETEDYDCETNTYVSVRATTEERAAELERLVTDLVSRF